MTYVLRSFNKRNFSNKKEGHILGSHPTQDSSHHQDYYISRFQKFPNLNLPLPHCYLLFVWGTVDPRHKVNNHNPKNQKSTTPGCFPSVVPPSVVWALHLIESIHGIWIHWCRDHCEGHRTVEGHLVRKKVVGETKNISAEMPKSEKLLREMYFLRYLYRYLYFCC